MASSRSAGRRESHHLLLLAVVLHILGSYGLARQTPDDYTAFRLDDLILASPPVARRLAPSARAPALSLLGSPDDALLNATMPFSEIPEPMVLTSLLSDGSASTVAVGTSGHGADPFLFVVLNPVMAFAVEIFYFEVAQFVDEAPDNLQLVFMAYRDVYIDSSGTLLDDHLNTTAVDYLMRLKDRVDAELHLLSESIRAHWMPRIHFVTADPLQQTPAFFGQGALQQLSLFSHRGSAQTIQLRLPTPFEPVGVAAMIHDYVHLSIVHVGIPSADEWPNIPAYDPNATVFDTTELRLFGSGCPVGDPGEVRQDVRGFVALVRHDPDACELWDALLNTQTAGATGILVYTARGSTLSSPCPASARARCAEVTVPVLRGLPWIYLELLQRWLGREQETTQGLKRMPSPELIAVYIEAQWSFLAVDRLLRLREVGFCPFGPPPAQTRAGESVEELHCGLYEARYFNYEWELHRELTEHRQPQPRPPERTLPAPSAPADTPATAEPELLAASEAEGDDPEPMPSIVVDLFAGRALDAAIRVPETHLLVIPAVLPVPFAEDLAGLSMVDIELRAECPGRLIDNCLGGEEGAFASLEMLDVDLQHWHEVARWSLPSRREGHWLTRAPHAMALVAPFAKIRGDMRMEAPLRLTVDRLTSHLFQLSWIFSVDPTWPEWLPLGRLPQGAQPGSATTLSEPRKVRAHRALVIPLFDGGRFDEHYNSEASSPFPRALSLHLADLLLQPVVDGGHPARLVELRTARLVVVLHGEGWGTTLERCAGFCPTQHTFSLEWAERPAAAAAAARRLERSVLFKDAYRYDTRSMWYPSIAHANDEACESLIQAGVSPNQYDAHASWRWGRNGWCSGLDVAAREWDVAPAVAASLATREALTMRYRGQLAMPDLTNSSVWLTEDYAPTWVQQQPPPGGAPSPQPQQQQQQDPRIHLGSWLVVDVIVEEGPPPTSPPPPAPTPASTIPTTTAAAARSTSRPQIEETTSSSASENPRVPSLGVATGASTNPRSSEGGNGHSDDGSARSARAEAPAAGAAVAGGLAVGFCGLCLVFLGYRRYRRASFAARHTRFHDEEELDGDNDDDEGARTLARPPMTAGVPISTLGGPSLGTDAAAGGPDGEPSVSRSARAKIVEGREAGDARAAAVLSAREEGEV